MRKIKIVLLSSILLGSGTLWANLTNLQQLTEADAINEFKDYFDAFGKDKEKRNKPKLLTKVYDPTLPIEIRISAIQEFIGFLDQRAGVFRNQNQPIQTMIALARIEQRRLAHEQEQIERIDRAEGYTQVVFRPDEEETETAPPVAIPQPRGFFGFLGFGGGSK
ncbi:MAG: hypothetical protein WCK49_07135 [Myxococcaceae bacterium]